VEDNGEEKRRGAQLKEGRIGSLGFYRVHLSDEGTKTRPASGPGCSLAHMQREQKRECAYEKINNGPSTTSAGPTTSAPDHPTVSVTSEKESTSGEP
jgi:hypothetical protein